MLTTNWEQHKTEYDVVVVGSGYGGSITAARLAAATHAGRKLSVCILERGRERWPGNRSFPDTPDEVASEFRSDLNPDGMYELLMYPGISVLKGCGLGGTSLINANVAAVPDAEVFEQPEWPKALTLDHLRPYYDRARTIIGARPDPRAWKYPKVHALDKRARELGMRAVPLDLAINFTGTGINEFGMPQAPCRGCGDCDTGCNKLAKRALYMNYLPMARNNGAQIFTQSNVDWVARLPGGGWRVYGRNREESAMGERFTLDARSVILAAGSIHSTELLLRSQAHGLSVSPAVGTRFSGNGDFFGIAYNGDSRTLISGIGNNFNDETAKNLPGPAIVSGIHYNGVRAVADRFQVEDLTIPSAFVEACRRVFPTLPRQSANGDSPEQRTRIQRDQNLATKDDLDGAFNHSMMYMVMSADDASGRMVLDSADRVRVEWADAGRQRVFAQLDEELRRHAQALGASHIANPMWSMLNLGQLTTSHPLGGCPVGEDYEQGAVDEFGRVFRGDGGVHDGLFVADGAIVPRPLGVNPFLTISALAERIAERMVNSEW